MSISNCSNYAGVQAWECEYLYVSLCGVDSKVKYNYNSKWDDWTDDEEFYNKTVEKLTEYQKIALADPTQYKGVYISQTSTPNTTYYNACDLITVKYN